MRVREYVLQQLQNYNQNQENIAALEFELKSLPSLEEQSTEIIEAMALSCPFGEHVQNSSISDKTAAVALNYPLVNWEMSQDTRRQIVTQLYQYEREVRRLDIYMAGLSPKIARVLRAHYFELLPWPAIAERERVCLRSVMRWRDQGISHLEALYTQLARIGALPEVTA